MSENKVFGRNPVLEVIKSGADIEKIMIKKGKQEGSIIPIVRRAREAGIFVQEVDKNKLDFMAEGENHQGIIAVLSEYSYSSIEDVMKKAEASGRPPLVIICDKITDPHNLGAIIRTADCAGAHGVIIPKRNSVGLNSVVAKTSAGAIAHMPVVKVTNLVSAMEDLKERGLWIAGADMAGDNMYKANLKGALGIVIGSEGDGISRLVKEKCDFLVSVPMQGEISSLNASVAASLIMYEAVRQRME